MSLEIRYFSGKTGHTRKLMEAVGETLNVTPKTVNVPLDGPVDTLVLGCAVYAYGVDDSVKRFLKENKDNIGELVLVSSAALLPDGALRQITKICNQLGIKMSDKEYHCYGAFHKVKAEHPTEEDILGAIAFAKTL